MGGNYILGVDLGSSNTRAAVFRDGQLELIPDGNGHSYVPTMFALSSNQEPLIGWPALERAERDRENTIFSIKRLLGRPYSNKLALWAKSQLPYKICQGPGGDVWVEVNGQGTSIIEIFAYILAHVKSNAEAFLGEQITQAVLTVPAHYNSIMRQLLKQVALAAGFHTTNIINATTAAGLALWKAIDPADLDDEQRTVAVVDMGGSTFNAAILGLTGSTLEVLSAASDPVLGGDDFDLVYLMHLVNKFKERHDVELATNLEVLHRIRGLAKQAKHDLSKEKTAAVDLPYITALGSGLRSSDLSINIDRRSTDQDCQPLIDRMMEPLQKVCREARIRPQDVHDLILIGGMTSMLLVRNHIVNFFELDPVVGFDPETAVSVGAAVQGALKLGRLQGVSFAEVTPAALSIETQSGTCVQIIPENTSIPVSESIVLSTSGPDQSDVSLRLLQGNSEFAEDNITLGSVTIDGIKKAPRGIPDIEVKVSVDKDGVVELVGTDKNSGASAAATIAAENIDEQSELLRKIARRVARKSEEESRKAKQKEAAESQQADLSPEEAEQIQKLREELRNSVFSIGFKLEMEGEHFRGPERDKLDAALQRGRELNEGAATVSALEETIKAVAEGSAAFDAHLADFS